MELMQWFWVVLCVLVHSTHAQICTQSLLSSVGWWKTLSVCKPWSINQPYRPSCTRAARWLCEGAWTKSQDFTHQLSPGCFKLETAKKGGFTQPAITGNAQEKRPICLKTWASLLRKKELGEKSTFGFQLGSWRAPAAPSGDLSCPRQQQLLRRRGWTLQEFTGIDHWKLWQSAGGVWGHGKVIR